MQNNVNNDVMPQIPYTTAVCIRPRIYAVTILLVVLLGICYRVLGTYNY